MKTIHYNKLVRDKIPNIIEASSKKAIWSIASDDVYYQKLKDKLVEELDEFLKSDAIEELADLVEVVEAILATKSVTISQFNDIRAKKNQQKGAFTKKFILNSVVSKE